MFKLTTASKYLPTACHVCNKTRPSFLEIFRVPKHIEGCNLMYLEENHPSICSKKPFNADTLTRAEQLNKRVVDGKERPSQLT